MISLSPLLRCRSLLIWSVLSLCVAFGGVEPTGLRSTDALCETSVQQAAELTLPQPYESARWEGLFPAAAPGTLEQVLQMAYEPMEARLSARDIRRVKLSDVPISCSPTSRIELDALRAHALAHWKGSTATVSPFLLSRLRSFGYQGFSSLYVNPSGAGNWRRGGRSVKAVVPYNLYETLTAEEWESASGIMEFLAADDTKRPAIFAEAKREQKSWVRHIRNVENVGPIQTELARLIQVSENHAEALSPLELRFAQAAVESARTGYYVHFDMSTSRGPHAAIRKGIAEFKTNFRFHVFVPNPELNARIHQAIATYIAASEALHETHVLGYQEEVHPINPPTHSFLYEEEANGIGAGMIWNTLEVTGRAAQLQARGVEHGLFQNIEVLSTDLLAQFGAYLLTQKKVAVVLVPSAPGYVGGAPYWRNFNGQWEMQLIEDVALPSGFKDGNDFFNSNTMFYRMGIAGPTQVDFEVKPSLTGNPMFVPKMSAGLITTIHSMGAIRGEIGSSYQDFKRASDYRAHGHAMVRSFQDYLTGVAQELPPVFTP